ncbi:peroxiredoxin [Parabacteroides sp. PF5-5]|uniref:peroxiredoxin family protein n=1 Tax=unclassified Parabacteroides TaxID=2649774 RepID=UPI0024761BE5|nr:MULTISPECIES: TlpA disulfide reductase family protein [unclassified Parabacteroides]MDH6303861.1 peroxiredoxin [Parabacteroides sp. PH5-39]MDH6314478.1 peroxiredoxin [Parabacteroides sp. PF5-13]MDH6318457.1 peroxiredoxin [Parabacteroides sp. PH5-13]MDH6322250.1 peroxiredoxin [Parabacteroides sp. PH5-8]MDH6325670.1 peroxiredoxin [Parabacteroides sp. PH5-41]
MKTHLPLFVLICCVLFGCGSKGNEVVIEGFIAGLEDGVVMTLNQPEGRTVVPIGSDTVKNQTFMFSYIDSVPQPKRLTIMSMGEGFPPTWLDIWVEPGAKVKITGEDKLLRTWGVNSNVKEQKEWNAFAALTKEYTRQTQAIMRDAYALFEEMDANPDKSTELRAQIRVLYAQNDSLENLIRNEEVKQLEKGNTGSAWLNKLYSQSMAYRYMESYPYEDVLRSLATTMTDDQKNSDMGKTILSNLNPPTVVKEGDEMADTELYDVNDQLHHLADYKGKYILLDFWSAGCGPCIAAIPEMKEISEQYKDKLTVISISSDSKDLWKKTSAEKDITWINLNDFKLTEGIFMNYGVTGIPHYAMISPEGILQTYWFGYGKGSLHAKMKELVK